MLAAMITSPLELRSLLRSEIKDGQREVVRLTDEQLHMLNTLRGSAPGGGRRGSGDRQDDARDRQGAAARRGGVRDPARLLQLAPRARARGRDPRGGAADRAADGQHVPPAGRGPRARGRDPAGEAGPGDRRVVRRDDADRARRGDREARAALPRDRGRRGAGLRCRLAGVARRAAHRWSRGRHVRLPRPGAVDLPSRPDRGAGPDRIPARLQLPQPRARSTRCSSRWPSAASPPRPAGPTAARPS